MPWRRGDINGRSHRHAASHFRHVLSLHDEAHLEPLNPQFVLSRRVAFDLVVEAGEDDPCNMGINTYLIPEPMGTCVEMLWFWSQNPWEINSFLAFALSRVVGKG